MPSTSRGYPYPSGSDDVDIPGDMQALAAAVNTDVGTVVTNAVQHSLADAAGDVIVASANDAWARKALGTDNHVLTVDTSGSGAAKVAWEDPTANPLTVTAMAAKAPLANPTFTGTPAAPTAAVDTNTTQIATTAFTVAQIADDAVLKTVADAAGDLVVGSAADTFGRLALGTDNHVLTVDTAGSGVAKVGWEDPTANPLTTAAMALKVNTATVGNLLTANQASIETDTTGWAVAENCTLAASTTQAKAGTYSLRVTAVASSYMDVITSGYIPVTAGQTYTVSGQSRAGSAAREISPFIFWYDAGNVELSATATNKVTNSTSGWTRHLSTAVAPATATQAKVMFRVYLAGASEMHYLDELGLWEGAGGQWALPGTPITNLGFYTDESVGRRLFQWDANNARWQQTYSDTGVRLLHTAGASLLNGWVAGPVHRISRVGNMVTYHAYLNGTGASTSVAYALPAGFVPESTIGVVATDASVARLVEVTSNVTVVNYGATEYYLSATWRTADAWPTTLPGSAVGSIPA